MTSGNWHLILLWFLLGCASSESLEATVGTDVTLQCTYDAQYYGALAVCWGRGSIPNRGCAGEVIRTDGSAVTSRLSERYLLTGNIREGDVSLTIRQLEESDSGMYGCRVDIPGWFNDHKHEITLTVVPGRPYPIKVETREVKERTVTVHWNHVFDGGRPITTYRIDLKNKLASWDTAVITEVYNPDLSQVTLVDLRPARTYNLRMFAINSVGMSDVSNVLTVTTKEGVPEGPPLDAQLQALSTQDIRVTWKPPKPELRNGVLRSYMISYREYDPTGRQSKRGHQMSVAATKEVESIILTNLKPSTMYIVTIHARTYAGTGPPSIPPLCSTFDEVLQTSAVTPEMTTTAAKWKTDSAVTSVHTTTTAETAASDTISAVWEQVSTTATLGLPDPPVVELKEVKDHTISLLWTPGFEGGSPIISYYLEYKAINASWDYTTTVVDYSPNETETTIIEMNPSTYNIRMFARNSLGSSRASNVLTFTVEEQPSHDSDSLATTPSTDTKASVSLEDGRSVHFAAIAVPVVLVVLVAAIVTTWQLRRLKRKKGSLDMWLSHGVLRYRGAESLQEL